MNELIMREAFVSLEFAGSSCGCLVLLLSGSGQLLLAAGSLSVPNDAQAAFDKQQYEQVLEQFAKLEKEQDAIAPDVHRLKIRPFLKAR